LERVQLEHEQDEAITKLELQAVALRNALINEGRRRRRLYEEELFAVRTEAARERLVLHQQAERGAMMDFVFREALSTESLDRSIELLILQEAEKVPFESNQCTGRDGEMFKSEARWQNTEIHELQEQVCHHSNIPSHVLMYASG
jgi:hypothetical protein